MRWKALTFLGKLKSSDKDNYGFWMVKCPSSVKKLVPFGNDMMDMIKNLKEFKFKRVNNEFQSNLRNDITQNVEATTYLYWQTNLAIYTK